MDDGSYELCDELACNEERITTIHQENRGVSAARNRGIEYLFHSNAQGCIEFLDADDLWCPNVFTEEVVEKIKTNAEVFCFGCISSNSDCTAFSNPLVHKECICDGGAGVSWPIAGHFCANLYSIDLLARFNIRFINGLKYSEDKIFKMHLVYMLLKIVY